MRSMTAVVDWLRGLERRMFYWVNQTISHATLDRLVYGITHMGGATFTISLMLLVILAAPNPWKLVGLQGLLALGLSHLPVHLIKKRFPRRRPYLSLPDANVCARPLQDPSFPSGHTTAIFSILVPFVIAAPWLAFILLPIGAVVAMSRIYLGLHYPSDCAAGCAIGSVAAIFTVAIL
jgi:undecaprenyl-diphosphatase